MILELVAEELSHRRLVASRNTFATHPHEGKLQAPRGGSDAAGVGSHRPKALQTQYTAHQQR